MVTGNVWTCRGVDVWKSAPIHVYMSYTPTPYFEYSFAFFFGSTFTFVISPPAHCMSFGSITLNHSQGMEASPKLSNRVVSHVAAHHFREARGNG